MNTMTNLVGGALAAVSLVAGCATRSAELAPVDMDRTGPRGGEVTVTEVLHGQEVAAPDGDEPEDAADVGGRHPPRQSDLLAKSAQQSTTFEELRVDRLERDKNPQA